MERIKIPEISPKSTHQPRNIPTYDEWEDLPARPLAECPKCRGAGFMHPRRADGIPDFGKLVPCSYVGCYGDSVRIYKMTGIAQHSGALTKQTFETFNPKIPGATKAYNTAKTIAEGDSDFIWLLIYGGTGNGKSHLLNAVTNRVIEQGKEAKLIMMSDLLSQLRIAIETNETDAKLKQLKEVPYLLIDELGTEYGTDWEKAKIDELLTSRWANGRFTIVATNRDISELPERLRSRFQDKHLSRAIHNEAGDYRLSRGSY